jgi:glycosyltransferase involved in cell wall biosynthesis
MTSTNQLRVAICTGGVFPHAVGGSQRHTKLLVEHLARFPDLKLVVVHPHETRVFTDLPDVEEVRVKPVSGGIQYLFDCYEFSKNVRRALESLPDDTVIYGQCLAVWSGVRAFRDRFIFNPHGLEPYQAITWKSWLKYTPMREVHSWLFRQSRHVVSLGGRLTDIIRRHAHHDTKIHVLPNAISPPENQPAKQSNSPCRLLFVGRHVFNKGIVYLLDAMRLLNAEGFQHQVRLDLVGAGPLLGGLRDDYAMQNVEFHGGADDSKMLALQQAADLFVFPTLFEGMPTAVMEAMACGTPIAVTDTGATLDLLTPDNGFLLRKQDARHIAETVKRFVLLSEESKLSMGAAARKQVVDRFTWDIVAAEHRRVFREVAARAFRR